jgi:hypothetical protein
MKGMNARKTVATDFLKKRRRFLFSSTAAVQYLSLRLNVVYKLYQVYKRIHGPEQISLSDIGGQCYKLSMVVIANQNLTR